MSTLSVIEYSLGLSFYFYFKIITLERYVFTQRNKTFETNTAKPSSEIEYSLGLSFYFYFKIITLERYVFTQGNKTFETNTAKPFLPHVHKRLESTRSMRPSCAACRGKKKKEKKTF